MSQGTQPPWIEERTYGVSNSKTSKKGGKTITTMQNIVDNQDIVIWLS